MPHICEQATLRFGRNLLLYRDSVGRSSIDSDPTKGGTTGGLISTLVRLNAHALAIHLRKVADGLEAAAPGPPATAIAGWATVVHREQEVTFSMGEITVQDDAAPATGQVTFKDAKGFDTAPDGVPVWTSSDESVATVTASEDGMSASVAPGNPGSAVIQVEAFDDDGTNIIATGLFNVTSGEAQVGEVTFTPGETPA